MSARTTSRFQLPLIFIPLRRIILLLEFLVSEASKSLLNISPTSETSGRSSPFRLS